ASWLRWRGGWMLSCPCEPTSGTSTWVELLRWRASSQPERRADTYLSDEKEKHPTHAELGGRAPALGPAPLQGQAGPSPALLLCPPGLEFVTAFFGCLYAQVAAIPAYPPHPARRNQAWFRFWSIQNDAQPSVVLTTSALRSQLEPLIAHYSELRAMRWLTID